METSSPADPVEKRLLVPSLPRWQRQDNFAMGVDYLSSRKDQQGLYSSHEQRCKLALEESTSRWL